MCAGEPLRPGEEEGRACLTSIALINKKEDVDGQSPRSFPHLPTALIAPWVLPFPSHSSHPRTSEHVLFLLLNHPAIDIVIAHIC